jgi:serine/threonine protein phosphatase PrpC
MMTPHSLEAAGATRAGPHRTHNEDHFAVLPKLGLFMVADGVGGQAGGEIASRLAVDTVREFFERGDPEATWPFGVDPSSTRDEALLTQSLWRANRRILDAAQRNEATHSMGATFAGIRASAAGFCAAHVGDSRIYRFRDGRLELLTEDHSLRTEYLRRMRDPHAVPLRLDGINLGLLTRALGLEPTVDVDTRVELSEPGDIVLVCTDGLSGPVSEGEIAAILTEAGDLDTTAQRLIERAHSRGGRDDVTCVLVRWRKKALIHKARDPRAIPQHALPQASSARCVSRTP